MTSEMLLFAAKLVERSRARGADSVRARASRSRDVSVEWRDGRIETVTEATSRRIALEVWVGGRYTRASTSDLREPSLEAFVTETLELARILEPDAHRRLPTTPDSASRTKTTAAALLVRDSAYEGLTVEDRVHAARELEGAARHAVPTHPITNVSAFVGDSCSEEAYATSDGLQWTFESTLFHEMVSVTSWDETAGVHREASAEATTRFWADLPASEALARGALARARGALGSKKIATVRLPMVVEARVASALVWPLTDALSGPALQQGQSFLEGRLGKRVASGLVSMTDDPLVPKGLGSRPYDADGFSAQPRVVIDHGTLSTYFVDDYYARKLRMSATTSDISNLLFAPGDKDIDAILADLQDAILVTGFFGGYASGATGDFSIAVTGHRVRKGIPSEPITEMNIAANLRHLWQRVIGVGNDPYPYSTARTPTLVFDGLTFV